MRSMKTTRLIDADAVISGVKNRCIGQDDVVKVEHSIISMLYMMPTIDEVPVKRGKWIKADSQQYFRKHYPCFICSECGYRKDSQKKWNYCPNCGADTRGEG